MSLIYVTGLSGAGKSAVLAGLVARGHVQERASARDQHADPLPGA